LLYRFSVSPLSVERLAQRKGDLHHFLLSLRQVCLPHLVGIRQQISRFRIVLRVEGEHPFIVWVGGLLAPLLDCMVDLIRGEAEATRDLGQSCLAACFRRFLAVPLGLESRVEPGSHSNSESAALQRLAVL